MKKNVGTRIRPIVRTERDSIVKRLKQAGRAYDAGRSVEANEARIKRLEARLVEIDTPPAPVEAVEEIGTLVTDPIFGEVLEIELEPLPPVETVA